MDSIIVKGGNRLVGDINIHGAKNASLPILIASMLTEDEVILHNIPPLSDITTTRELLKNHGTEIIVLDESDILNKGISLKLQTKKISNFTAPYDIVKKMRASIWALGALVGRFGKAKVSLPGGCTIGARMVDLHIDALRAMNIAVEIKNGYIYANCQNESNRPLACDFHFNKISVGATINSIFVACFAADKNGNDATTNLHNCAIEPEIIDLCNFLTKIGANITIDHQKRIITIKGRAKIQNIDTDIIQHKIIPDRIEAATYMIAAVMTKGDATLHNICYEHLTDIIVKLKECGSDITKIDDTSLNIKHDTNKEITSIDITTAAYPGFATDMQAQFMSLMTLSNNRSVIKENIFENRLMHVPELIRMGANITIEDKNTAIVQGVKKLTGATVMASDLRASVSLILAGLVTDNETTKVKRVYHLDRGYFALEEKLSKCGVEIHRESNDSL